MPGQRGVPVQEQHELAHPHRAAREAVMGALIDTQIASLQSIGQRQGLKKTETKPFTGDGIHAAGSISNKSDAVVVYAIQTPGDGDRAARGIDGRAGLKIAGKLRELTMQRGEAEFRI